MVFRNATGTRRCRQVLRKGPRTEGVHGGTVLQGSRYRGGERCVERHPKLLSRAEADRAVEFGRRHSVVRLLPSAWMRPAKERVVHRSKRRM
eukprot:1015246-Pleurochrysis_carterae.AAC.1